jgi:hypothetical protein
MFQGKSGVLMPRDQPVRTLLDLSNKVARNGSAFFPTNDSASATSAGVTAKARSRWNAEHVAQRRLLSAASGF